MAKLPERSELPDTAAPIPGLKPPVWDFGPGDDGDPAEVDRFIAMIRALRDRKPADIPDGR